MMIEVITGGQPSPNPCFGFPSPGLGAQLYSDSQRLPAPLPQLRSFDIFFFLHLLFKIKTPTASGSLMFMPQ